MEQWIAVSGSERAVSQNAVRAEIYLWLSGVFAREQTSATLAAYLSGEGREVLARIAAVPALGDDAGRIVALTAGWKGNDRQVRDLAAAFARLFLVYGPQQVPVYESVYTSERGRICQQATTEIGELLGRYGLSADGWPEPADHIAVELELLAYLTFRADNDGEAEAGRRELLARHLLLWGPEFCARCIASDTSGFYAAAARILDALLVLERTAPVAAGVSSTTNPNGESAQHAAPAQHQATEDS
ncbi:TorD/DmsD family molecular chaperone [Tropicimonas sp.]|uniref:TorD/DmsD family molecular chaperone n=1 Tax=Tropicimonas sp. TaxID=2067044 RepID=UPI003A8708D6